MAVIFFDGFSQYKSLADMEPRYAPEGASVADYFSILHGAGAGPRGNSCLRHNGSDRAVRRAAKCDLGALYSEIRIGMNFMFEGFNASNYYSLDTFLLLRDDDNADEHIKIKFREHWNGENTTPTGETFGSITIAGPHGHLYEGRDVIDAEFSGQEELGYTADNAIIYGQWYYLEFYFKIGNGTDGIIEYRKDGKKIVRLEEVDTADGLTSFQQIWFSSGHTSASSSIGDNGIIRYADFHVIDPLTSPNTEYLYPAVVETLTPSAEVSGEIDWLPSSGSNNAALVDDVPPNFDTDFVSAQGTVANTKDRYTTTDELPNNTIGVVHAVQPVAMLRDVDDRGNQTARVVVYDGTTEGQGATKTLTQSGYQAVDGIFETNPDTGLPWTKAEVEAAEFGIEIV